MSAVSPRGQFGLRRRRTADKGSSGCGINAAWVRAGVLGTRWACVTMHPGNTEGCLSGHERRVDWACFAEGWHAQGRLVRLTEGHKGKVGGRPLGEFGRGERTTIPGDEGEMAQRERRS